MRLNPDKVPGTMVGMLVTVIFHLTVIIIMLCVHIGCLATHGAVFEFDFTRQEEEERISREENFKQDVSRHLDELLREAGIRSAEEVRNVAVDATAVNEETQQLIDEGKKILEKVHTTVTEDVVDIDQKDKDKTHEYHGPAVVSYTLDGRKASHLKIPAYKCMGGGEVTVTVMVDPQGNVVGAKINDAVSSSDTCLRNFALKAARASRFSRSASAPLRQPGEIVYRFVAQ